MSSRSKKSFSDCPASILGFRSQFPSIFFPSEATVVLCLDLDVRVDSVLPSLIAYDLDESVPSIRLIGTRRRHAYLNAYRHRLRPSVLLLSSI